jgi:hypothetical protein
MTLARLLLPHVPICASDIDMSRSGHVKQTVVPYLAAFIVSFSFTEGSISKAVYVDILLNYTH